jgi:hypothetical protein
MVSTEPQTRPISSHLPAVLAGVAGILLAASGCARTRDGNNLQAWAMEYRLRKACMPRPNHLHILRADLAAGNIQPAVVLAADPDADGPAEAALTHPLQLAHDPAVLAFINTNPWDSFADADGKKDRSWFEGQPVEILGLAASGGQMRSLPQSGPASIWLGGRERVFMGECPAGLQVAEGLAGFQPIVREGAVVAAPGGPIHPRTAMGVDPSGSVLWLVVVDGRQAGTSEGMTLRELGRVMRRLGCWNAINMDGGGSSVMGLADTDGRLRIVNRPSDRRSGVPRIRPLPAILTLRRSAP